MNDRCTPLADRERTAIVDGLDASPDMLVLAISNCVINLSTDKPRVPAEAFRVLRPGGLLAVSDVIADHRGDDADRIAAEQLIGCTAGTLTAHAYRDLLTGVGFTAITITPTGDAAGGLYSAIVRAIKPNST